MLDLVSAPDTKYKAKDKILSNELDNKKYEICVGIKTYFPKSIFVKKWIYFETDEKIKEKIEHYDNHKTETLTIEGNKIKSIEYGGNLVWFFKIFTRKQNKLEIKLKRITDILYIKKIEDKIEK